MTDTARGRGGRDRRGRPTRARGDAEAGARRADADRTRGRTTDGARASTKAGRRARERAGNRAGEPRRSSRQESTGRTRPVSRRPRNTEVLVRAGSSEERPGRARYLTRRWLAVLIVLGVVGLTYLVMFTSVLGVRSVEVLGVREIPKDDVIRAAAIEHGTPMVRLDADEAAARVATLPKVFEVRVERSWPSTVEIVVTEREPVAVLLDGDEVHLVDATGLDYAVAKTRPAGLPLLAMSGVRPQDPATRSAVAVLGAIPKQLEKQVVQVTAGTPGDVQLTLSDGRVVKWGNAENSARKAAVLAPLLTRPGKVYDVATPDFPTVSG